MPTLHHAKHNFTTSVRLRSKQVAERHSDRSHNRLSKLWVPSGGIAADESEGLSRFHEPQLFTRLIAIRCSCKVGSSGFPAQCMSVSHS